MADQWPVDAKGWEGTPWEDVSDRDNSEEFYDYNFLPLLFESAFIFRFSSNATNL